MNTLQKHHVAALARRHKITESAVRERYRHVIIDMRGGFREGARDQRAAR